MEQHRVLPAQVRSMTEEATLQLGKDVAKYGAFGAAIMGGLSVAVDKYQIDHERTKDGQKLRDHVETQNSISDSHHNLLLSPRSVYIPAKCNPCSSIF